MPSTESEALPYWLVNVPADRRPAACPDFLADASEKDRRILATRDTDFHRLSWPEVKEIIRTNHIELFQRVPSELRLYKEYMARLKKEHGSVMAFVMKERLQWSDLVATGTPFTESSISPLVIQRC